MKNLKSLIAIIAIGFSTLTVSANEIDPNATNEQIRKKIVNLLGKKISLEVKQEQEVEISFMVNEKNEMVVVSVTSEKESVDRFVKNKLNYKAINVKGVKKGEIYKVPLKIKKA